MLHDFGISDEGALYKSDLRSLLLQSNRVVIVDPVEEPIEPINTHNHQANNSRNTNSSNTNSSNRNNSAQLSSKEELEGMSIANLKALSRILNINIDTLNEKQDIVSTLHSGIQSMKSK